jgi:hypothetical protein
MNRVCDGLELMALSALSIVDGSVMTQDGHDYLIRIAATSPDKYGRAQVQISAEVIDEHGELTGVTEQKATDDEPAAIHDQVHDLIADLGWWWRSKQVEAENAERDRILFGSRR